MEKTLKQLLDIGRVEYWTDQVNERGQKIVHRLVKDGKQFHRFAKVIGSNWILLNRGLNLQEVRELLCKKVKISLQKRNSSYTSSVNGVEIVSTSLLQHVDKLKKAVVYAYTDSNPYSINRVDSGQGA